MTLLALFACHRAEDPEGEPLPEPPACVWEFPASEEWDLPSPFGMSRLEDMFAGGLVHGSTPVAYDARFDWTGSEVHDLLVSSADLDGEAVPAGTWSLYPGRSGAFDGPPESWQLPDSLAGGKHAHIDLDGDGVGEAVATAWEGDAALGTTRWDVFSAFSQDADPVELPAGYPDGAFANVDSGVVPGVGFLADLAGDDRLDLVDIQGEGSAWDVYVRSDSGFSDSVSFVLPPLSEVNEWDCSASSCSWACDSGRVASFDLADVDGDGSMELVRTADCDDPSVGATRWLVHPSLPTGFDPTPVEFPLPLPLLADEEAGCGASDLVDADGDGLPDLVVSARCDDGSVGRDHLQVFPGTGTGFGEEQDWTLPDDWPDRSVGVDWLSPCDDLDDDGDITYRQTDLFPLTGGPLVALQIDACDDPEIGSFHWLYSEAVCR